MFKRVFAFPGASTGNGFHRLVPDTFGICAFCIKHCQVSLTGLAFLSHSIFYFMSRQTSFLVLKPFIR